MKFLCRSSGLAATLAASVAIVTLNGSSAIADKVLATDPGFNPDTGQINPGVGQPVPTSSHPQGNIPTTAQIRAAMKKTNDTSQSNPSQSNSATTGSASANSGDSAAHTRDAGPTAQRGPVGSTPQTVPAKFSSENDTLDRVPTMALPPPLSDDQQQRIYQAVMSDKNGPAADADKLAPASELSPHQALDEMHPLPQGVGDIATVKDLKYLKTKDKVFLVEPSTRTVVAEITK